MKRYAVLSITLAVFVIASLFSCKKEECKECYFIEEVNGSTNETSIGEFCDEEIAEKENQEFIPVSGTAHNECRD